MKWIKNYTLFMFDFDGLLVNTEELHFQAYREMCRARGYLLPWTIDQFFNFAHLENPPLEIAIYTEFPQLKIEEPKWSVLYGEKQEAYRRLLLKGEVSLQPGVEPLLKALAEKEVRRCVVTHSSLEQVNLVRSQIPLLNTLPLWITRECYHFPKPDPEPYQCALQKISQIGDSVIGFEDSLRGLKSLQAAFLTYPGVSRAVLISPFYRPHPKDGVLPNTLVYPASSSIASLGAEAKAPEVRMPEGGQHAEDMIELKAGYTAYSSFEEIE